MVQLTGRKDGHQGYSKVVVQVLVLGFVMDLRMAQWVAGGLVDPGVQGGHIHIEDLLPWVSFMVECHSASPSAKESIARVKGWSGSQRGKERRDRRSRVNLLFPRTLPFDHRLEACIAETL